MGLPGLDAIEYLRQGDEVAAALLSLMHVPIGQLPVVAAEAACRIADSLRNEQDKFLLLEMLEAYLQFATAEQEQQYRQLLTREEYRKAYEMGVTTFEKGVQQGIEQGMQQGIEQAVERQRETTAVMIEKRFGSLTADVRERLHRLSADELNQLWLRLMDAETIEELWTTG